MAVRGELLGCTTRRASALRTFTHKRQWIAWQVGLSLADVLAAVLSIEVALLVGRAGVPMWEAWRGVAPSAVLLAGFWLLFSLRLPGHLPRPHRPLITTAHQCLIAVALGSLVCIAILYVIAPTSLPERTIILPASACMFVLMLLMRQAAAKLAPLEPFVEKYLIVGNGNRADTIIEELGNGLSPYKSIVGLIPVGPADSIAPHVPIIDPPESAYDLVRRENVTHLILCHSQPLPRSVARCVLECEAAGAHVSTMERAYEALTKRAPIFHVEDEWVASLESATETFYASRGKRAIEVVLAAIALAALGPLIAFLALLVKLTSEGPAFYLQERVGKDGRPFVFAKLRTMVHNAEAETGPVWAKEHDPRATPVGRILRSCRLDELPQLWNVLRGDMSLIGPRPERAFFVRRFMDEIPLYGKRLLVRPGITGWAQVHHRYDQCQEDVIEKLRYDLFYIGRVSFKLDLLILLKTIGVVLSRRGAH
jgi:exopolysaccharide biosynthesis polyprenyl glycosylphosphotransferase